MLRLLSLVRNLEINVPRNSFPISNDSTFPYQYIKKGEDLMQILFDEQYIGMMGSVDFNKLLENSVFFLDINNSEIDQETRRVLISNMTSKIETLSTALWVIKDNAVWPEYSTIHFKNQSRFEIEILRRNNFISNSNCEYDLVTYSESELNEAKKYFELFSKTAKVIERDNDPMKDGQTSLGDYLTFDAPSFSRALLLLMSARRSDIAFAKISMYISTLECLLAVDGENTHKVSERVAHFIGKDSEERQSLFRRMKKYYGIRSIFIHGSELKLSKHDGLKETSFELDKIVRSTFKKLMDQYPQFNYNNKEIKEENRLSREQVNNWFDEMVLK